ncbi:hypothetical protein [Roseimicrobium sp. ORNL1]|uniref:hypothetical protein n=1 Tax=Roseimicrobium sp. ORNL1 TaxID=2711231 RepID=UPI0013E13F8D|nr:hypothetical protein [Roseimicrobium sp. ORNL1]QIF03174.1 hypothetical protein G5S37_17145 [Roseimicrobium sp. ORNL1]
MSAGCIIALVLGVLGGAVLLSDFLSERNARGLRPARAQMQGLVLAVKAYQTEYSRLPALDSPPPTEDNTQGYDTTSEKGRGIIKILTGEDESKNPRNVPFFEPPARKKSGAGYTPENGLVDTWGTKGYVMILDYNSDGEISIPGHPGGRISSTVIIYSAGPDGDYNTWDDNITSWQ